MCICRVALYAAGLFIHYEIIFPLCLQYLKLRTLQRASYTHYFYEATVGAGLPIISTLRGLLETGDKILRIEGIFRCVYASVMYQN